MKPDKRKRLEEAAAKMGISPSELDEHLMPASDSPPPVNVVPKLTGLKMKRRHHIIIWLSLALSVLALGRTLYVFPHVRIREETTPAYEASANSYLRRCLSEMVPATNGVHFLFVNDNYGVMRETVADPRQPDDKYREWTGDCTLAVGEYFMHRPDHHRSSRYTLTETNATGVVIEYETRFDHRSFGKNLINVNKGRLRIPWQKKDTNQASGATLEPAPRAASSAPQG